MDPIVQVSKKYDRRVPGEDYGTSGNAGGGTPIRHKRQEGHTSAGGRTSSGIPPHSGTATLHGDKGEVIHSDSRGVPYYTSESSQRRRLGKAEESFEVSE